MSRPCRHFLVGAHAPVALPGSLSAAVRLFAVTDKQDGIAIIYEPALQR